LDKKILNDEVDFPEDMSLAAVLIVMAVVMKNLAKRLGPTVQMTQSGNTPSLKGLIGRPYRRNE
jgi:hypothetical protein